MEARHLFLATNFVVVIGTIIVTTIIAFLSNLFLTNIFGDILIVRQCQIRFNAWKFF